jgi:hypothetical protein
VAVIATYNFTILPEEISIDIPAHPIRRNTPKFAGNLLKAICYP